MRKGRLMTKRTSLRKCQTGALTVHQLYTQDINDRLKETTDRVDYMIDIWNEWAPEIDNKVRNLKGDVSLQRGMK